MRHIDWNIDPVVVDRLITRQPVGRHATAGETLTAIAALLRRGLTMDEVRNRLNIRPFKVEQLHQRAKAAQFCPPGDWWHAAYADSAVAA